MLALSVRADDREPETGSLQNWLKYAGIMRYSAVTVSAWKFADQDQFVHQDKFLIPFAFFLRPAAVQHGRSSGPLGAPSSWDC